MLYLGTLGDNKFPAAMKKMHVIALQYELFQNGVFSVNPSHAASFAPQQVQFTTPSQ